MVLKRTARRGKQTSNQRGKKRRKQLFLSKIYTEGVAYKNEGASKYS
jgi:hypothetical protein